jgi:hypothetical protein
MPADCGCDRAPCRLCEDCYALGKTYTACSLECLDGHQKGHGALRRGAERARWLLAAVNANHPDSSLRFTSHRRELMCRLEQAGGGRLAIFGAGNASDLDLPWLAQRFDEVHLVDFDEAALERAAARQPAAVRERLVLHGGVDLSGLLGELDTWGEPGAFPAAAVLGARAVAAARGLVAELGVYDVTLSACVLSQLVLPFRSAWVAPATTWANLAAALQAVHLATLAGATARRGVLAFDVQSSRSAPALASFDAAGEESLDQLVVREIAAGTLRLSPEPRTVMAQLASPGLAKLVENPRLSSPWLWDLGETKQLVYALEFDRPTP